LGILFSIAHFQGYDEQILCIPPFIEIGRELPGLEAQASYQKAVLESNIFKQNMII
jgi:hypothetical protein